MITHKKDFAEVFLMIIHNIRFHGGIRKISILFGETWL